MELPEENLCNKIFCVGEQKQFTKRHMQWPMWGGCVCVCFGKAGEDIKHNHTKVPRRYNYVACISFYSL